MKRKKVMTITALVFTCATIASCGKTTETVNAESVVQATEQIVLETETEETPQVSADQGEGDSISLQPTMVDGVEVWPDFPEKYVKFEELNPEKTMYCIDACTKYFNPNMKNGELVSYATLSTTGDQLTFNATCEIDGEKYFRFTQEDTNLSLIVPADCWSETPPAEDTTSTSDNSNSDNSQVDENGYIKGIPILPPNGDEDVWDQIDPEIIDQMGNLTYE